MCGIAGFFGQRWIAEHTWRQMLDTLAPRGPDAQRVMTWTQDFAAAPSRAQAALLHTRLSIRDLRAIAHQPMVNPAGDIWICFNGEVYGWERDSEELKGRGYAFNTTSDTEFILHGFAEWGLDVLSKLRGKFALAILDRRIKKLYLIRDRMGIKPLVYFHRPGEIAFGSTVRAVLPYLAPEERGLSTAGIDAYLAHRYVPAPNTVFTGVHRLRAGHYAEFDLVAGALEVRSYWSPRADPTLEYVQTLSEAVTLRTVSDRPVGLFLSGGIDSTVVASILAGTGHREIAAYTAAFPGTAFDEAAQAAQVAQALHMSHSALPIEQRISEDFERIVADLDEPFADPSSIPLWYLAREASRHVRVVMGGDGGDELFAGYKRYAIHVRSAWRGGLHWSLATAQNELPGRLAKVRDELSTDWLAAYSLRFSGMAPSLRRYLQPELGETPAVYWDRIPTHDGYPIRSPVEMLLAIDMNNYLPEYILRKSDLCTMAHGLELRVPLLDHRFYEALLALPRARRFTKPPKLALAAACHLCVHLGLFEQKKRGFNPPLASWLRGDLGERLNGIGARLEAATSGQIAAARAEALVRAFRAGHEPLAEQVLQLLILDVSLRQLRAGGTQRVH